MRKLSAKQKKRLDKWVIETGEVNVADYVVKEVEAMNDYETCWMDINRYVWDQLSLKARDERKILNQKRKWDGIINP